MSSLSSTKLQITDYRSIGSTYVYLVTETVFSSFFLRSHATYDEPTSSHWCTIAIGIYSYHTYDRPYLSGWLTVSWITVWNQCYERPHDRNVGQWWTYWLATCTAMDTALIPKALKEGKRTVQILFLSLNTQSHRRMYRRGLQSHEKKVEYVLVPFLFKFRWCYCYLWSRDADSGALIISYLLIIIIKKKWYWHDFSHCTHSYSYTLLIYVIKYHALHLHNTSSPFKIVNRK